ncbi:MAG TPA: hypothetical protein VMZ53_01560 [Kofleriaceae bacterium]|nr:hypothetical protein [Kofleriaceae bacterium]
MAVAVDRAMGRQFLVVVGFFCACGGSSDTPPTPDAPVSPDIDAAVDAPPPPPLMFGIDTSPAPSETYTQALATVHAAGATFVPQAIDWSMLEAGPDDTFGSAIIDAKKWDVTGPFAADKPAGVVRYTSSAASGSDHLHARYALATGSISARAHAKLNTPGNTQATVLLRFGTAPAAGNRCTDPADQFAAVVLLASGAAAAATCQNGVFATHGTQPATAAATIQIRRTTTQIVFEVGSAQIAALNLSALPAAFAGTARLDVFAGNDAGAATVELSTLHVTGAVTWDNPTDRFVGVDAAFDVPALLDLIHGPAHTKLVIILRTINTVTTELPSDLEEVSSATGLVDMSRADIKQRYHAAIDYLIAHMPSVEIVGFSVGNEIDGYLGSNATAWAQVASFANDAIPYAKSKLPNAIVGITVTADGMIAHPTEAAAVNAEADAVFLTYYPLAPDFTAKDPSVVPTDIARYLAATTKPVFFIESGYPSAGPSTACPTCTGSEAKQAAFFHAMFVATDTYPTTRLRGFTVIWMTDVPDATVQGWKDYYGISAPTFLAYLATLGVRTQSGAPKQAWTMIQSDAHARGL